MSIAMWFWLLLLGGAVYFMESFDLPSAVVGGLIGGVFIAAMIQTHRKLQRVTEHTMDISEALERNKED